MANNLKFTGKAPELIKIAIAAGTVDTFFDSGNDYEPVWFDAEALQATYGGQIFTDVTNQKNMVWTSSEITGTCFNEMNDFINNTVELELTDVPGVDVGGTFVPDSNTVIK